MARAKHIPNAEYPYHIVARVANKEKYPIPLPEVWRIYSDYLWAIRLQFNFVLHAFVLMPNHFHMIASTPDANLSEAMNYFLSQSTREINFHSARINQLHGARFFRSLITSDHYSLLVYKYVYRNPVKAMLARYVEEYKYSSLAMYCGLQPMHMPLSGDANLMSNMDRTLNWLNTPHKDLHWQQIRQALKKKEFQLPYDRKVRQPSELENMLI